eukprot:SAG25_NODE_942_length_4661_cov_85.334064_5_plen_161_part_00
MSQRRRRPATRGAPVDPGQLEACGVCQDPADAVLLPDCGHRFCFSCINGWCREQNTCPHCRKRVHSARHVLTGERVQFAHKDLDLGDDDDTGAMDDHWVPDAQVICFGMGTDNACKWRNGEFDALSMSEQIQLEVRAVELFHVEAICAPCLRHSGGSTGR